MPHQAAPHIYIRPCIAAVPIASLKWRSDRHSLWRAWPGLLFSALQHGAFLTHRCQTLRRCPGCRQSSNASDAGPAWVGNPSFTMSSYRLMLDVLLHSDASHDWVFGKHFCPQLDSVVRLTNLKGLTRMQAAARQLSRKAPASGSVAQTPAATTGLWKRACRPSGALSLYSVRLNLRLQCPYLMPLLITNAVACAACIFWHMGTS